MSHGLGSAPAFDPRENLAVASRAGGTEQTDSKFGVIFARLGLRHVRDL